MTKNLHNMLTELKATLRTREGDAVYELSRAVLDSMPVTGYGREMRLSALDALDNVLDAATNSGTVENLFELRESLDNGAGEYGPTQDNDETMKLLGELWNFSFAPEDFVSMGEPIAVALEAWNQEIGIFAQAVLVSYIENNFPEFDF